MERMLGFVYLFCLSLWMGSLFFLLLAGISDLSEKERGRYILSILPRYFSAGYVLGILSLITFYVSVRDSLSFPSVLVLFLLIVMNALYVVNGFAVLPKAEYNLFEYYRTGSEGLRESFWGFWKIFRILNFAIFISGIAVIFLTSLSLKI